jgi:acetyltransferase-like isoleucine patch superfamily enzyme
MKMLFRILDDLLKFFIIYIPGPTGRKIRYYYWKKKFRKCGKNVLIDEGVIIENPEWISIGDNVWIDKYSILIAGPVKFNDNSVVKRIENKNFKYEEGELIIGNGIHIGIGNIIQAHGGVYIGNNVTTSAGVKIYSLSNYPCDKNDIKTITYANCMASGKISYILSPVVIEDGVWIALNSIVLGGTVGKNSFISSNSIVYKDIPENSYASGNPAEKIKDRFQMGAQ